ncbi:hypothetical protein CHUAL_012525 [Chamberlinius hualienensis]
MSWNTNGLRPWQQMMASCTGAVMTSLLVTPLDVVKIRLQAQQKAFMSNKCFLYCNGLMDHLCPCVNGTESSSVVNGSWYKRPGQFSGTIDAFIKIARFEGIRSLWSGLPPTLIMAVPSTVIYFTTYEQIRAKLRHVTGTKNGDYSFWIPLISGTLARTGSAVIISPLELVRTKMQSKKMKFGEVKTAIRLLIVQQGYLSLWKGLGPTILRDVPFSAIYWTQYEFLKSYSGQTEPSFWYTFMCGAISGTVAGTLTLPFDVVKTHRQIELGEMEIYTDYPKKSRSTYHILGQIYTKSGVPALFTGLVPRLIKVAPACAIMISTYEFGKRFFRRYNESHY